MDSNSVLVLHMVFFLPIFLPLFLGLRTGWRETERSLGFVAENCPKCETAQPFKLLRIGVANSVLSLPVTQGIFVGHWGTCRQCNGGIQLDANDYAAVEADGKAPLAVLIAKTNPRLGPDGQAAGAAADRLHSVREFLSAASVLDTRENETKGNNFAEIIAFLAASELAIWVAHLLPETFHWVALMVLTVILFAAGYAAFLWSCQKAVDRFGGGGLQFGLAAYFLMVVFMVTAVWGLFFWWDGSYAAAGGWLALGLALTCVLAASQARMRFNDDMKPSLVAGLAPIEPTLQELEGCLKALREHGQRCRFMDARNLLEEIAAAKVYATGTKAAASVPAPAGPQGKCPNCGHRIPLDSIECPVPKCGALFGEGSAWKIKPK